MVELLKWDTEHFGMKVGELVLENVPSYDKLRAEMSDAKSEGYDVLYLKGVKLPDNYLDDSIVLADEKVVYAQTIKECDYRKDEHVESILHKGLDAKLLSMALQSGGHSRYYTDKRFPLDVFLNLYETWITNSLNGTIATDVIAYVDDNRVDGFITYKHKDDQVTIGLVDVDNTVKGKGIGSKLMQSFLSLFPVWTKIEVATQLANSAACRYYEKNGFTVESVTNIYHLWL